MPSTLRVQLQLRIVSDDDTVIRDEVILQLDKSADRLEAVGLCLAESKDLLGRLQHAVIEAQAAAYVDRHRCCSACGRRLRGKGHYPIVFRTAFGHVPLASPRFYHCPCRPVDSTTFSPLAELFTEHTAPELLYLESRWASLIFFGMTVALLKDADLGGEPAGLVDGGPAADQASPIPREAIIVGIDGGYLRNWHDKKRNFEVIVGKSMAEDRDDRYFGLVRSQDAAPARRLCEVLRRQGLPTDQPVTVLTDGGDSVRALVSDLPAGSEHYLDWFHVAMRLTGLTQYAKGLAHYSPLEAAALQDRLERIQWRLWHGDADEALNRARELAEDVAALSSGYPGLTRLITATAGLVTYIENNAGAITDYAGRWDHGEIISTAFAEATVDLVVSRRFVKKQQMQWSKNGAHRLLQTRTRTLDGTLHDLFTSWYPAMPANDGQPLPLTAAA